MAKIGCVTVCRAGKSNHFMGLECPKGRGKILPGGKWEPEKDKFYQHGAARELYEEIGLIVDPEKLEYLWHGPDGYKCDTFAFLTNEWKRDLDYEAECKPIVVSKEDLLASKFGAWYDVFFKVCGEKLE